MLSRQHFLTSGIAAAATLTMGTAATAASASKQWDLCVENPSLPYNRPLGLKMQALDAPDFDLMALRGHPVMINLFASWCGPCIQETPMFVAAANEYYAKGLRIVGINYQESDNTVRGYRKRFNIPYPLAMDRSGAFVKTMQRGTANSDIEFPTTLFISRRGMLYCDVRNEMSKAELDYRIRRFLKDG